MAKFVENFQGKNESILCPLCSKHIDNQKISFEKLPSLEVKHQNIRQLWSNYNPSVPQELVNILIQIDKFRENNNEKLSQCLGPTAPYNRSVMLGASDN